MHEQTSEPAANLGDQIVGWVCTPGLLVYLAWHLARWAGA